MRAVIAAFAANLGIAVIKFVAFLLTGSASMLAESVHSVADTGNQVLLFVGRGRSIRPASDEHPFGFGRERYFYGFIVSVMLFTVGAVFSVYEGVHKITNPEEIRSPLVPLIVLAVSAVLEGFSLRTAIREANHVRGDRGWGTFIRRTKSPELPVVLLEDTAALIGWRSPSPGGLAVLDHNGRWDGVGSLWPSACCFGVAAAILAVEMKTQLIGESASADAAADHQRARGRPGDRPGHPHAHRAHGPDSVLVAAKVAVRGATPPSRSPRASTPPSAASGPPCPASRRWTWSGTSTARATPTRATRPSAPSSAATRPSRPPAAAP
jgi:cation diffusion facilitator family transporter